MLRIHLLITAGSLILACSVFESSGFSRDLCLECCGDLGRPSIAATNSFFTTSCSFSTQPSNERLHDVSIKCLRILPQCKCPPFWLMQHWQFLPPSVHAHNYSIINVIELPVPDPAALTRALDIIPLVCCRNSSWIDMVNTMTNTLWQVVRVPYGLGLAQDEIVPQLSSPLPSTCGYYLSSSSQHHLECEQCLV